MMNPADRRRQPVTGGDGRPQRRSALVCHCANPLTLITSTPPTGATMFASLTHDAIDGASPLAVAALATLHSLNQSSPLTVRVALLSMLQCLNHSDSKPAPLLECPAAGAGQRYGGGSANGPRANLVSREGCCSATRWTGKPTWRAWSRRLRGTLLECTAHRTAVTR